MFFFEKCRHSISEFLIADLIIIVLVYLLHDLLPQSLILGTMRIKGILQLIHSDEPTPISVYQLKSWFEIVFVKDYCPVYGSSYELSEVYYPISIHIHWCHQYIIVFNISFEHSQYSLHTSPQLFYLEGPIPRGV